MPLFNATSSIPRAAVVYVTIGALTVVWSAIWYVYVLNNLASGAPTLYWCYGFMITGLTLMLIGLTIGWFARSRRPSGDIAKPREEVSAAAAQTEPITAATAPFPIAAIAATTSGPTGSNNRSPSLGKPAYESWKDGGQR